MLLSLQWSEWLRRPQVRRFDAASPIAVEDYLDGRLPTDTTVFVFDDADRPMLQSLESQWGNGRFSTRKLAEIFNALVEKERRVAKFNHRDMALQQLALELMRQGKSAPITNVRNHVMITNEDLQNDHQNEGEQHAETEAAKVESPAEMKKRQAAEVKAEKEAAKAQKAEAAAAAKAEKEAAKAAATEAKAAARAEKAAGKVKPPKATGVIGTLITLLTDGSARTVDELHAELLEKFPERGEGMKTTVRVQLARLGKEGRLVVHADDRHDAEGKKLVGKNYWGEPVAGAAATTATDDVQEAAE